MDYSQILASQMVDKGAWTGNEDAFYDGLSLDGFAKMRGAFKVLKETLRHATFVARQYPRKRARDV